MAMLSGGGNWFSPQKQLGIGESIEGVLVSYERDVPAGNPAFPAQDVMVLEVDGAPLKIGCNASIRQTMRANPQVKPGAILKLTNRGEAKSKKGMTFKRIDLELIGDASFPPAANEPMCAEAEIQRRLDEARARRAA